MGAIIGSATGNAGAGIGAAVGLLGGAVIGDQMQARQKQDEDVQRQMAAQQAEIERQHRELNQLKAQQARSQANLVARQSAKVTQEEKVYTTFVNGFRYRLLLLCLIIFPLAGCPLMYYTQQVTSRPDLPPKPEPPQPSGTLLEPQFRIGIAPVYMPLAYKDPTFGLIGVEVDFADQLATGLGKKIVFVETPFPELIQALLEKRIDIIMSGMSITSERAKLVSFTDSYAQIGQMALVRAKDRHAFPNVQSFSKLTSKIGFVQETTGEVAAKAFFPQAVLAPQVNIEGGITALRKGEIEVFIHDAPTIWRIAGNPNERELEGLYWLLTKEELAWAVRKDDEPLRVALNRELQQWKLSGRLKQTLSRWVPLRIW